MSTPAMSVFFLKPLFLPSLRWLMRCRRPAFERKTFPFLVTFILLVKHFFVFNLRPMNYLLTSPFIWGEYPDELVKIIQLITSAVQFSHI